MPDLEIHDVQIPMRDGVRLHTRLYLPPGGPHPVLLRRTPYPWEWMGADAFNNPNRAVAEQGYALAVQYVRGRFESEGRFEPFHGDVEDGYDTIDWLATQPWSTGAVGMYGQSYEASVQLAAVLGQHPALRCIVPQAFGTSYVDGTPYYSPGIFSIGAAIGWAAQVAGEAEAAEAAADTDAAADTADEAAAEPGEESGEESGNEIYQIYQQAVEIGWHEGLMEMTQQFSDALLPVLAERPGRSLAMMATHAPWWTDWLDSSSSTAPYWVHDSAARREELAVPALHVSGWLDPFLQATIDRYLSWSSRSRTPALRTAQRLILGPWAHGLSGAQWDGHVHALPEAELFAHPDIELFHRRWLHDDPSAIEEAAPIRIFVMGDNVWRDEWEWPLARTEWTPLYLADAGTSTGGGSLSPDVPGEQEPDSYEFDPADPVPAIGGAVLPGLVVPGPGQYDQRSVESRDDVLVYTAAPSATDLEVTGPVSVDLWVETSAVDTDFTAKLVDVFPSGEAVFVCQGIVRPTVDLPGGLEPKAIYHLEIDLTSTSYVFKAGHAVRLEVSSSCFPLWDVNPNTGRHYATDETGETVVARQTIHHDRTHPSHLTLPVIPRTQPVS